MRAAAHRFYVSRQVAYLVVLTVFCLVKEARSRAEKQAIQQALKISGGTVSRAAELLGVSRPTLYDLVAKYGIQADATLRE